MTDCADQRSKLLESGKEFEVSEARALVSNIIEDCPIDTEDRFHNVFFHEICPLVVIAEHIGDKQTRLSFTGEKFRFDGLIRFGDELKEKKVELTVAIDGRNDALQMELMKKRGDAPGFQKIQSSGTKKNRKFGANESRMVSSDNHDRTTFSLLEDALNLKLWKANTNENYRGAWLGIIFDDWFCPSVDRKKKRFDPICDRVLEGVAGGDGPFSRVFFIGVSRQYIFDSSETMGFGN